MEKHGLSLWEYQGGLVYSRDVKTHHFSTELWDTSLFLIYEWKPRQARRLAKKEGRKEPLKIQTWMCAASDLRYTTKCILNAEKRAWLEPPSENTHVSSPAVGPASEPELWLQVAKRWPLFQRPHTGSHRFQGRRHRSKKRSKLLCSWTCQFYCIALWKKATQLHSQRVKPGAVFWSWCLQKAGYCLSVTNTRKRQKSHHCL